MAPPIYPRHDPTPPEKLDTEKSWKIVWNQGVKKQAMAKIFLQAWRN